MDCPPRSLSKATSRLSPGTLSTVVLAQTSVLVLVLVVISKARIIIPRVHSHTEWEEAAMVVLLALETMQAMAVDVVGMAEAMEVVTDNQVE